MNKRWLEQDLCTDGYQVISLDYMNDHRISVSIQTKDGFFGASGYRKGKEPVAEWQDRIIKKALNKSVTN